MMLDFSIDGYAVEDIKPILLENGFQEDDHGYWKRPDQRYGYNPFSVYMDIVKSNRKKSGKPVYRMWFERHFDSAFIAKNDELVAIIDVEKVSMPKIRRMIIDLNTDVIHDVTDSYSSKPHVLIFKTKHEDQYFYVDSVRSTLKAFRKIFEEMDEMGYYSFDYIEPPTPTFTKEQIDNLPAGEVKNAALKEHTDYEEYFKQIKEIKYDLKEYESIKSGSDISLWSFMSRYSKCEYHKWQLEKFHNI